MLLSPTLTADATRAEATQAGGAAGTLAVMLDQIRTRHALPGLAAAFVTVDGAGNVVACGQRARGLDEPFLPGDRVHLGSCTKAMTATLVALLVAEGALRWESTVPEILGSAFAAIDPSWNETTVEELLRHEGGAPAQADPRDWAGAWACRESSRECRRAFVKSMLSRPIAQPRGSAVYSNQGYAIVGAMIEELLDEDFETVLVRRLLEPIGITSAGFGAPPEARGHPPGGEPTTIDNPAAITPASRVHMTMEDWGRFMALHLRRDGGEVLPLRRADLDRLHALSGSMPSTDPVRSAPTDTRREDQRSPTPGGEARSGGASDRRDVAERRPSDAIGRGEPARWQREGYALGWIVTHRPWGGRVLTHAGSNTQWFCVAWLAPDRGFAMIAATNQGGDDATKACDEAVALLLRDHLERSPGGAGAGPP